MGSFVMLTLDHDLKPVAAVNAAEISYALPDWDAPDRRTRVVMTVGHDLFVAMPFEQVMALLRKAGAAIAELD